MPRNDDIHALLKRWQNIEEGVHEPEGQPPVHPERVTLYGGISGLPIAIPEFRICDGLLVRETYAHVMAPYLLAFGKPRRPGAPHPPPWKSARGGLAFDVTIEVVLAQAARPTGLDRLNTLWWVLALLRLVTGAPLRMPVVSDIAFAAVPSSTAEPNFWSVEMPPRQLRVARKAPTEIMGEHLEWVRDTCLDGALLLEDDAFNRAFQTFDSAIWAHSPGSAIVMAWASLETLFRPGRQQVTKTLASCVASFLYQAGPARDRAYQKVVRLYEARGSAAHDAQLPEAEQLLDSFDLARLVLTQCLEARKLPNPSELMARWKNHS
jgi:hypothetical protein